MESSVSVPALPGVGRLGSSVGGQAERVKVGERRVQGGKEVEGIRAEYLTGERERRHPLNKDLCFVFNGLH